ncbi:ABC transporter substrate-binding protein [Streptomyces sp. NPDC004609]|uniref:ABC transporter substrate-binding protein n=1 Tax=Streptomyces sp. NPDC004609 TaxID=3364704 RepID=UPI0036A398A1
MKRALTITLCLGLGAVLTGCGTGSSRSDGPKEPVADATIAYAIGSDPGNLDPQLTSVDLNRDLGRLAYDSLVYRDENGDPVSGLASSWKVGARTSTFQITPGVTCSDGSKFTADVAAQNLKFIIDPKNGSPYASSFPSGSTVSASGSTVTLTTPSVPAFLLVNLADIPMVCEKGLKKRKGLASATAGTGPYVLTDAKTGSSLTYQRRDGYTWGPGGATTAEKGQPKTLELRIVADKTTAANLLVAGEVNITIASGPDGGRLLKMPNLFHAKQQVLQGLIAYNEASGRPTRDQRVREALTRSLDLGAALKITTGGHGEVPTSLLAVEPKVCPGNTVAGNLPTQDVAAAKSLLDQAGWVPGSDGVRTRNGRPLTLDILTPNFASSGYTDGAAFLASQWRELGIKVTVSAVTAAQLNDRMFRTADFDVSLVGTGERTPNQNSQYFSGEAPPKGTNFASFRNPAYDKAVNSEPLADPEADCARWNAGEVALLKEFSLIPYANLNVPVMGNGVEFKIVGNYIVPTSLRAVS